MIYKDREEPCITLSRITIRLL